MWRRMSNKSLQQWRQSIKGSTFLTKGYFLDTQKELLDNDGAVYKDISILKDVCFSFARDRYDLLKSLSTETMKTLIEKGCPNTFRKTVNSGKRLRAYVRLEEGDVCSGCNWDAYRHRVSCIYICSISEFVEVSNGVNWDAYRH